MGIVALGSFRSAAVTTSALAICRTWPDERAVLLAEVDPSGGMLAARIGLRPEPGLQSLAADARRGLGAGALDEHAQALSAARGGAPCTTCCGTGARRADDDRGSSDAPPRREE